ncbi:hypothetical protein MMC09_000268 [Bachmanniomyces sp. S44760]|nr:hypothetical protein [Bachmanniomyces sp. S44760]
MSQKLLPNKLSITALLKSSCSFLYETRTLRTQPSFSQKLRAPRAFSAISTTAKPIQNIPYDEPKRFSRPGPQAVSTKGRTKTRSDSNRQDLGRRQRARPVEAIPFNNAQGDPNTALYIEQLPKEIDDTEIDLEVDRPDADQRKRNSTITASEQSVFDRIFSEIARSEASDGSTQGVHPWNDDDLDKDLDANDDLTTIFQKAIDQSRIEKLVAFDNRTEKLTTRVFPSYERTRSVIDSQRYPPSLREAALDANRLISRREERRVRLEKEIKALGDDITSENQRPGEPMEDFIARKEDMARVTKLMDDSGTDAELWDILQSEVFGKAKRMIEYLQAGEEVNDEEEVSTPKIIKRGRKPKINQQEAVVAVPEPVSAEQNVIEDDCLLPIMQANYARQCLHALRLYRTISPTSPYALNIIPTIKRLGPMSYALGASIQVYNEALFIRWKYYQDIHGVADLLNEMMDQGIGTNEVTAKVPADIRRQLIRAYRGDDGEVVKAWWDMQGQKNGLERVWEAWRKSIDERNERERREQMAAKEQEEGEDHNEDAYDESSDGQYKDPSGLSIEIIS